MSERGSQITRQVAADVKNEWLRLHKLLTTRFINAGNLPDAFAWPLDPTVS